MNPMAKGLAETVGNDQDQYELRPSVRKDLESLKWYLWHGHVLQALPTLDGLQMDVESAAFETKDETARKLLKQIEDLQTYVERNPAFIPNFLSALTPLQPRYAKKVADEDSLMAVIMAQVMNLGNHGMSETSDIPYHSLD